MSTGYQCYSALSLRLILIAERNTVYEKFPTPLINRLEKHFVLTSSVLHDWQQEVLQEFEEWIRRFSHVGQTGLVLVCLHVYCTCMRV